jgi:hypothetical protein
LKHMETRTIRCWGAGRLPLLPVGLRLVSFAPWPKPRSPSLGVLGAAWTLREGRVVRHAVIDDLTRQVLTCVAGHHQPAAPKKEVFRWDSPGRSRPMATYGHGGGIEFGHLHL